MSETSSCFVQKLSHYVDLAEGSMDQIARLEENEISFDGRTDLQSGGERNERIFVVKSGWLYTYTDLPDGRRQIICMHHPGDIVGLADVAFHHKTTGLRTCEPVCLCPFPKSGLTEVFRKAPQLAALLFALSSRDQTVIIDRVRALGRMSAREKLIGFLLDLIARLRITNENMTDTMRLPLTQSEIGDAVGLTNVYVSRTMNALEGEGYVIRMDDGIRLLREDTMKEIVDFHDRHDRLDLAWVP